MSELNNNNQNSKNERLNDVIREISKYTRIPSARIAEFVESMENKFNNERLLEVEKVLAEINISIREPIYNKSVLKITNHGIQDYLTTNLLNLHDEEKYSIIIDSSNNKDVSTDIKVAKVLNDKFIKLLRLNKYSENVWSLNYSNINNSDILLEAGESIDIYTASGQSFSDINRLETALDRKGFHTKKIYLTSIEGINTGDIFMYRVDDYGDRNINTKTSTKIEFHKIIGVESSTNVILLDDFLLTPESLGLDNSQQYLDTYLIFKHTATKIIEPIETPSKPFLSVIEELSTKWNTIDEKKQDEVIEAFGVIRDSNILRALIGNKDVEVEQLNEMESNLVISAESAKEIYKNVNTEIVVKDFLQKLNKYIIKTVGEGKANIKFIYDRDLTRKEINDIIPNIAPLGYTFKSFYGRELNIDISFDNSIE